MPSAAAMTDRVICKIELVPNVENSLNDVNGVVPLVTEGFTDIVVSSFYVHYADSIGIYFVSIGEDAIAAVVAWGRRNYMLVVKTVR